MKDKLLDEMNVLLKLDLSKYPSDRFRTFYEKLDWQTFDIAHLKENDVVIRARINETSESFKNVSEISYKPQKLNSTFQRASTPNKTMFYGTFIPENYTKTDFDNALLSSLFEVVGSDEGKHSPNIEQLRVTFGIWNLSSSMLLPVVMNLKDWFAGKPQANFKESRTWLNIPDEDILEVIEKNAEFLYDFYTKEVKFEYEYLPSAIFSEYLLSKGFQGIYYPGIKTDFSAYNVAITPKAIHTNLKLDYSIEALVYIKNGVYLIEAISFSESKQGKLDFKIHPNRKILNEKEMENKFNELTSN